MSRTTSSLPGGRPRPLSVLLLCDDNKGHAATVLDQIEAFRRFSRHRIYSFNPRGLTDSPLLDLREFDVVVIHYSIFVISDHYLSSAFREQIRKFSGLKIQLIQDDYRRIDEMAAMMCRLGIHVLYTLYPSDRIEKVWSEARLPSVEKHSCLAGYVPDYLVGRQSPPYRSRPVDIAYRGRDVPWWLGLLGQEKVWIGQGVLARAGQHGLICDIAWQESDRIYGEDWIRFLERGKACLGTESGASITDFDGSIEHAVKQYVAEHPGADFLEVHRAVLAPHENNVPINVISPRVFEAAALGGALVLFPGEYSGVLRPHDHYVPLQKDFSNFDEVAERLRDGDAMTDMIERARQDLIASGRYSFRRFIEDFDELTFRRGRVSSRPVKLRYALAQAHLKWTPERIVARSPLPRLKRRVFSLVLMSRTLAATRGVRVPVLLHLVRPWRWSHASPASLGADIIRLGLLRDSQQRQIRAGAYFVAVVTLDHTTGQLSFVSRPTDGWGVEPTGERPQPLSALGLGQLRDALLTGNLRSMTWRHDLVADAIPYPYWGGHVFIGIGDSGTYRFDALLKVCSARPQALWAALLPLVRDIPPRPSLWGRATARLRSMALDPLRAITLVRGRLKRLAANVATSLGAAVLIVHALISIRGGAHWLIAAVLDPRIRGGEGMKRVIAEMMRLAVGLAANRNTSDEFRVETEVAPGNALLLRSLAKEDPKPPLQATALIGAPTQIAWDHSAMDSGVVWEGPFGSLELSLGPDSRYEFRSLQRFLEKHPRIVNPMFAPTMPPPDSPRGGKSGPP